MSGLYLIRYYSRLCNHKGLNEDLLCKKNAGLLCTTVFHVWHFIIHFRSLNLLALSGEVDRSRGLALLQFKTTKSVRYMSPEELWAIPGVNLFVIGHYDDVS